MTNDPQIPFNLAAVEPVECLKAGWDLVKAQYWLFVGIAAIGMLIVQLVPLGILMGPMMCGMYLTFFKKRRGEPIEFGLLFKGFDYFGPSVVATLLHVVPIVAIGMILTMVSQGNDPNPAAMIGVIVVFAAFWLALIIVIIMVSIGFTFGYPLIVDRGLPGFDAVKLSFKAAKANFWRLLGLSMLSFLLNLVGVLFCYVGVLLVFPITFAAIAIAYEQVFGLRDPNDVVSNLPPPPPSFN